MKFVFSPPAEEAAGLLTLPWAEPLEDWQDERLVERPERGVFPDNVRLAAGGGRGLGPGPRGGRAPGPPFPGFLPARRVVVVEPGRGPADTAAARRHGRTP